jgi:CBS domain-containing protein
VFDLQCFNKPISELSLKPLTKINVESSCKDAINIAVEQNIMELLVYDNEEFEGLIAVTDFIRKIDYETTDLGELKVSEIMTEKLFTVNGSSTVKECLELFLYKNFRHLPVLDDSEKPIGILSIRDILYFLVDAFQEELESVDIITKWNDTSQIVNTENIRLDHVKNTESTVVDDSVFYTPLKRVLAKSKVKVARKDSVREVLQHMIDHRVYSILLVEYETVLSGIVTERDFLKNILLNYKDVADLPIDEFMTAEPDMFLESHLIVHALKKMFMRKYRSVIIVDRDRFPLGVISLLDFLRFIAADILSVSAQDTK